MFRVQQFLCEIYVDPLMAQVKYTVKYKYTEGCMCNTL